jgi:hypothetical protein
MAPADNRIGVQAVVLFFDWRRDQRMEGIVVEQQPVTGGCLCGAVRYEAKETPNAGFFCHCTMCQKHHGGLFGATVRIPKTALNFIKGQPTYYRSSAVAQRGFCAVCGSSLAFVFDAIPDAWISIGSLDRPGDWPLTKAATWGPISHLQVDSKVVWLDINDGLPRHSGGPLRTEAEILKST